MENLSSQAIRFDPSWNSISISPAMTDFYDHDREAVLAQGVA
jgi:hypothetical protein